MKIYIVMEKESDYEWGYQTPVAVFSTREKAEEYLNQIFASHPKLEKGTTSIDFTVYDTVLDLDVCPDVSVFAS